MATWQKDAPSVFMGLAAVVKVSNEKKKLFFFLVLDLQAKCTRSSSSGNKSARSPRFIYLSAKVALKLITRNKKKLAACESSWIYSNEYEKQKCFVNKLTKLLNFVN
jgi:hypothetical protein